MRCPDAQGGSCVELKNADADRTQSRHQLGMIVAPCRKLYQHKRNL
jgi:hypothetical protein